MKRYLVFTAAIFLTAMVQAQVSNPGIKYVAVAPSGSCPAHTLPVQVSYSNEICTCGAGTWSCNSGGGGSGTVSDGAGTTTAGLPAISTGTAHTIDYAANPLSPSLASPLGATYTLWINGKLTLAQTGGSGYSGTGTCTLTGGTLVSGSADTCTATQSGGAITFAIVGSGIYSKMPTLSFGGVTGGSGAWANVYNDPANTTIYVRDESTGTIVSGTDLNPLMQTIFNNSRSVNNHFYFKNGWYPINTLTQETNSGCTNIYAGIRIPPGVLGSWTQNIFTGESGTTNINEAAVTAGINVVQTNGVVLYLTPTALGTVSSTNFVPVVWQGPNPGGTSCVLNTYTELANDDFFENITFRLGTAPRAHSAGAVLWAAENTRFKGILADHNQSYNALAAGSAPPADSFGLTGSYSFGGEIQEFQQTSAVGWNVCYDWPENTESHDSECAYSNYPWQAGVDGSNLYHGIQIDHFTDQENAHGPVLGNLFQSGCNVDILTYDIEFGSSGWYARTTPNAVETNAGYCYGLITYSQVQQGGARLSGSFFTSGGGNFCILPSGTASASCSALTPSSTTQQLASYTFATVENPLSFGGVFSLAGSGEAPGKVPSAGIFEPITAGTGAVAFWTGYVWPNDQYSSCKIKAIGASSSFPLNVRMSATAYTAYQLNIGATGFNLYAFVTGTPHQIGTTQSVAASVGDTWKLDVQGSTNPVLTIYKNGTQVYQQTDSTYGATVTSGSPGFGAYDPSAITNMQLSSCTAGTP